MGPPAIHFFYALFATLFFVSINLFLLRRTLSKAKRGLNDSSPKVNFCGGKVNYEYSLNGQKILINEEEAPIVKRSLLNRLTENGAGKHVTDVT